MGNNLLNACKNTSAPTDQNDGENEQTQKDKQEKRKLERKKNQRNKSDLNSVHAEDVIESKGVRRMEEQSDSSSQQLNGFDGQSYQSQEINSVYNQGSEDQLHKMRKSQHKYSKKNKHLVNNFISSNTQAEKFSLSQQESLTNVQEPGSVQGVEEIRQLKNNNDKYFSKEDLEFYEIKYKNEKKVTPPKDRNIRWQQGEVLGTGSFGQVILGMNIDTGEFMAVKQVHIGGYNQQDKKEKIQQIQSEIEALQNFSDKNIVRYIGIKKSETSINIFLEYVPGGSISSLLYRYGEFNETLIRKFTQQILKGLEYLHAHDIIHRDIKGANVLVDKDGNCKLADFGSAKKIVEEKGHNDSIRGTPYWMAPETIKQHGSGRYADIWSIGCTVIEMATAKPPWADKNPIQAMFFIANAQEPPPIPENLSPDCRDFISKCLKINPKDRYNVRQLLNHPFISLKKQTQISHSGKQLAQITEEATVDYQTSSPDKRKDFLTRGESRGNTLFHEDISMKDTSTETRAFSIKTRTQKSTKSRKSIRQRESDGENSQDSIDLCKQKNSMNNPRPLIPQPKMIQPRSTQPQNYGSSNKHHSNHSGDKFLNSVEKNKEQSSKSSESSSRSSSNSSNSQGRKTNKTQSNYTNTENIPIRKKQVTPFSLSHKQTSQYQKQASYNQQQRQQLLLQQQIIQQQQQLQQPSEYSATKSVYTQDIEKDKSSFITKEQSYTSQSSSESTLNKVPLDNFSINQLQNQNKKGNQQQYNSANKQISQQERKESPYKSQNGNNNNNSNGQSLFANGFNNSNNNLINNYDSNSSTNSNKQNNENIDKKQDAHFQMQNIPNNYKPNLIKIHSNSQQVSLGQKQMDRKAQKLGELNDSSSSSSSQSSHKINQSPSKIQKSQNALNQNSNNKNMIEQNKQDTQKQLIFIENYNDDDQDEEEDDEQFQFNQKAVDSIMQYQGKKQNNTNYTPSEYSQNNKNTQEKQLVDTTAESFNREKFGKLRFSKPTSPKQLNTQVSGGTNFNNNSFDQIGQDNKTNNLITEYTIKNKIGSLKQEQVKEYSKYFGQQGQKGSRHEDYNTSSIDQQIINQYLSQNQKQNNNYQQMPSNNTRHIDSINIDDYSESQFESYNSKQEERSKQNIVAKDF